MTTDLKLELRSDGSTYDLVIGDSGDFEATPSLDTSLIVTALSDARAEASDVANPYQRRGWLGNLAFPRENSQLGSLLWLIEQRRRTLSNLNIAIDACKKAFSWYVDDGLAKELNVTGSLTNTGANINISILTFSGDTENLYIPLWKETGK